MRCKCRVLLEAMGQPNCQIIPERIKRFIFTPSLATDNVGGITPIFQNPPWLNNPWPQMYALTTPLLDVVNSERPEPVRETLGENQYFVRDAARTMTAIVAKRAPELGRLIDQLRCARELGVFLVDANGIVWGARSKIEPEDDVTPIPVNPATISSRMLFASADTVQKYEFSFELLNSFHDYELVPIWEWGDWAVYRAPVGVLGRIGYVGGYILILHALHTRGVSDIRILLDGLAALLQVQNLDGTPQAAVTINPLGNGVYDLINATAPFQVVIPPANLAAAWTAQPGFDWAGFRAIFPS